MEQFYYEYHKTNQSLSLKQFIYRIGSYHYNWHNDLELLLILSGEVEVCTNGVCHILRADDCIIINPNMGHATLAREANSIAMVLHIDPIILKEYYPNIEFLSFDLHSDETTRNTAPFLSIRKNLSRMLQCANKEAPEQKLLFESSFYELLQTIVSYFPPGEIQSAAFKINQKKLKAIDKMCHYIDKNYHKKISLDTLAKESSYNKSYVSQLFKSYLGINFYEYLTRVRLKEATRALSQSQKKILDIALENGFSDLKAFNSVFKETFQKSPTEYRRGLNEENCRHDILFKKEFLSVEDPLVTQKLSGYVSGGRQAANPSENSSHRTFHQVTGELSETLCRLSKELSDTALHIEEELQRLPKF